MTAAAARAAKNALDNNNRNAQLIAEAEQLGQMQLHSLTDAIKKLHLQYKVNVDKVEMLKPQQVRVGVGHFRITVVIRLATVLEHIQMRLLFDKLPSLHLSVDFSVHPCVGR